MRGTLPNSPVVLKAKICLVGDEAVGKTSLVHRFVHGVFDESYIRTLGAVPAKKPVDLSDVRGTPVHLDLTVLDIMGKLTFLQLFQEAYFHGARGILAVADVTRRRTLDDLTDWIQSVRATSGPLPTVVVVNKADLQDRAEYGTADVQSLAKDVGSEVFLTSAKTGNEVETAFRRLAAHVAEDLTAPR